MKRLFVVLAVLPLVATGCAEEGGGRSQRITVSAAEYEFRGVPDTIPGGIVDLTFRNVGDADHEFFVAGIGDTDNDKFNADMAKVIDGGPFPSYLRFGAIPGEVEPGQSLSTKFTLPAGEYVLSCQLTDAPGEGDKEVKPHSTLGMIQRIVVEGGPEDPELPARPAFVARDYTFDVPASTR